MIVFLTTLLILVFLYSLTMWAVHISMVKESTDAYGWASYKKFKQYFDLQNWDDENWGSFGLWDRKSNSRFFASIIKFNNKGMIIHNPIGYLMAEIYARSFYNKIAAKKPKRNSVKW